ncbi:MAG: rhomboid family intramembrane serine protease [Planctomycetota bacterium]
MGIHDREYVQRRRGDQYGRSGGFRSFRLRSVTAWLVVINVAVALVQPLLGSVVGGIPMLAIAADAQTVGERYLRGENLMTGIGTPATDSERREIGRQLYRYYGDGDSVRKVSAGSPAPPQWAAFGVDTDGGVLVAPIVAADAYIVRDPLDFIGHFSTSKAFLDQRLGSTGPELVISLEVWRFLSFQFLHGGFMHLFFNMLGLFIFGGMVERHLGAKRYLAFYLMCGIAGAIAYLALNFLGGFLGLKFLGALVNDPHTPLIGASGGVFGVIMAAAVIAPNTVVQLLFPPIPLKLKWMAYGYVAIAAWNLLSGGSNAGGDAAHLGGAIAGAFFIRRPELLKDFFAVGRAPKNFQEEVRGGSKARDEIDRILAKVSQKGINSLSKRERELLKRASSDE